LAAENLEIIEKIDEEKALPLITVISDFVQRSTAVSEKRLERLIRKAVGMELK